MILSKISKTTEKSIEKNRKESKRIFQESKRMKKMKIDIYTKVVMTVIAVSLVKIAICDDRGSYCVGVRSSGLRIEPN